MLIVKCPRCRKNNIEMANFWSEYLCSDCLVAEKKPLKQRQLEARDKSLEKKEHKCGEGCIHDSDCSVHNEPAYPNGECDCWLKNQPRECKNCRFVGSAGCIPPKPGYSCIHYQYRHKPLSRGC